MLATLPAVLQRIVRRGDLTLVDSLGRSYRFGDGSGPPVRAHVTDAATESAIAFEPDVAGPEAYMDGRLIIDEGSFYDLVALITRNAAAAPLPNWQGPVANLHQWMRWLRQFNPAGRARRNARHHYDINPRLFDLFLDADGQYSCAYFNGDVGLDEAQCAKKRHIAAKLALRPGLSLLDIGCGWGGLALELAREHGLSVKGITLSHEQLARARERARREGLRGRAQFELLDFRQLDGTFDRIVSVGMFEHVGVGHYRSYFTTLARLLALDGVALVHTIGRTDQPAATNRFIARHIFPGGSLPALSEITRAVEGTGLMITDVEVLRLHYALTLRAWRTRFLARRAEAVAIAGERFVRMWEAYLAGSEAAFRFENLVVFQLQLAKRIDALPITRDYMAKEERRLASRNTGHAAE
jgi:cyclopropane-fatty-acyl-phospholipid synthase